MTNLIIAALGASAGGLKALTDFFSNIDDRYPIAYVVTVHVPRDHKTQLPKILSRFTSMRVVEIGQGAAIEPYNIYINPPGANLSIRDGAFILQSRLESESFNHTIDYFFRSLAASARENAVGIIMSGTGSDGTEGLKAIGAFNGLAIVQDPSTAQFDGMPNHSIRFDHPDFILKPGHMPSKIYEMMQAKFDLPITVDRIRRFFK